MKVLYPNLFLSIVSISVNFLTATEAIFKEKIYTVAPGIEAYAVQIPIDDHRLHYFLKGGKTSLHRRYERENGLNDDSDVFGNLKEVLQRKREILKRTNVPKMFVLQNKTRSIRRDPDNLIKEDSIRYEEVPPVPLSDLDLFVPCGPYPKFVPTATVADDNQTYFTPSCLDIPICGGCYGNTACRPVNKGSKGYYYKVLEPDVDQITPKEHIRSFTFTYDKRCFVRCLRMPSDCLPKQQFNFDQCKCACARVSVCNPETHEWNEQECKCQCKQELRKTCKAGHYFAHGDCSCHKLFFDRDVPS